MKDQAWLSERIWDIMNLKNYSLRKLFPLAGMNSATELSRYLDGTNAITPSVLNKISEGLGISVSRLEQTDYFEVYGEIGRLLRSGENPERAEQLCRTILKVAVGAKEKTRALRDLGWSLYNQEKFDEAYEEWKKANKLAQKKPPRKLEKYTDDEILFKTIIDISNYHIAKKDYEAGLAILDSHQTIFVGNFERLGNLHQNRALCLSGQGNNETAKANYLISFECYKQLDDNVNLARVEGNIADIEFHEGNLQRAKELLESARLHAETDTLVSRCIIDKDLARVMICLGEIEEANRIIDKQLKNRNILKREELIGKLLLMKMDLTKSPSFGEELFRLDGISRELICCASDILIEIYMSIGDNESAKKYYNIMKRHILAGVEDYRTGVWF